MEVVMTSGGAVQSSAEVVTTNKPTPSVWQAQCPSCRPTNSFKALKGRYHISRICSPQARLGSSNFVFDLLKVSGYLVEGFHASHQPFDANTPNIWTF